MGRQSNANAVVNAVIEACGLYRVPVLRMQSRVLTLPDPNRRSGWRAFKVGEWTDEFGEKHSSGMADLLAQPRPTLSMEVVDTAGERMQVNWNEVAVPLWIECKSGTGRMTDDQKNFKRFVEGAGAFHICAHDCADEVLAWFKSHGVKR